MRCFNFVLNTLREYKLLQSYTYSNILLFRITFTTSTFSCYSIFNCKNGENSH